MPFVTATRGTNGARVSRDQLPVGVRYPAVSHMVPPATAKSQTIGLCGEGSPLRSAVALVDDWARVSCPKCKRLKPKRKGRS